MPEYCMYDELGLRNSAYTASKTDVIFEDDGGLSEIEAVASKMLMSRAMACLLGWVDSGDFSFEALDAFVQGISDLDGDGEVQEGGDEENYYNDMFGAVADAMASFGCDVGTVGTFINDGDSDAGVEIGTMLADKISSLEQSDDEIIAGYAIDMDSGGQITESFLKRVRDGVVTLVRKKLHRARQISSFVRAAIKKAGHKAHSAFANAHRAKSMRLRKSRGM